jgi:hypothetical protein
VAEHDVPALLSEVERLTGADGLARDALRRSGYLDMDTADIPLAEAIEKLNADARGVVRELSQEIVALRAERDRIQAAVDAVTAFCRRYTPTPPSLFAGPGLSEFGQGNNHGMKTFAQAVLGTVHDALHSDGSEDA